MEESRRHAGLVEFQVQSAEYVDVVDLVRGTFTCHKWEARGIPCSHVVAGMKVRNLNPYDNYKYWYLTSMYQTTCMYQTTYNEVIHVTRDRKQWALTTFLFWNDSWVFTCIWIKTMQFWFFETSMEWFFFFFFPFDKICIWIYSVQLLIMICIWNNLGALWSVYGLAVCMGLLYWITISPIWNDIVCGNSKFLCGMSSNGTEQAEGTSLSLV